MGHCDRCDPGPGCSLLYVYAILPEKEDIPPLQRAKSETVPPSWFDRAFSAYYERKTDEPIVAIIRQDIDAQVGAISPDGQYIATGGSVIRDVAISSVAEKRIVRKLAIDSGSVRVVAYSPDGRYLATGRAFMANIRNNESVNIWDARSGALIRNLPGPAGPEMIQNDVTALAFSPDSRTLAVSYFSQPDRATRSICSTSQRVSGCVSCTPQAPERLFTSSTAESTWCMGYGDERSFVYEVGTGTRVQANSTPSTHPALTANIWPRGQERTNSKIIDLKTGREVKVLGAARVFHRFLAYSPDGRYLAVHSDDGLLLWDL